MTLSEAKEALREHIQSYFAGAMVTIGRQSRVAKPELPLVTLTFGNASRPTFPIVNADYSDYVAAYQTTVTVVLDLFTHGKAVTDEDTGVTVAYENTAVDDMIALLNFLDSPYTIQWCHENDVAMLVDGEIRDLTGLINDNNYEYRSEITLLYWFTQGTVGYAGVLGESALTDSSGTSGTDDGGNGDDVNRDAFEQTSAGGGTRELADGEIGYFVWAEIKEEKPDEQQILRHDRDG